MRDSVTTLEDLLAGSRRVAMIRQEVEITRTDLLLSVMGAPDSSWARLIVERGGLSLRDALKRLECPQAADVLAPQPRELSLYRPSLGKRLFRLLVAALSFLLTLAHWFDRGSPAPLPLPVSKEAHRTIELARAYARQTAPSGTPAVGIGHLLLALSVVPGKHLQLLDNPVLVASATRERLGLGRAYDRLLLLLDGPHWRRRRFAASIRARAETAGRLSLWRLAHVLSHSCGLVLGGIWLALEIVVSLLMYVFLWPALLLFSGLRHLVALLAKVEIETSNWWEFPGGEVGCRHLEEGRHRAAGLQSSSCFHVSLRSRAACSP